MNVKMNVDIIFNKGDITIVNTETKQVIFKGFNPTIINIHSDFETGKQQVLIATDMFGDESE